VFGFINQGCRWIVSKGGSVKSAGGVARARSLSSEVKNVANGSGHEVILLGGFFCGEVTHADEELGLSCGGWRVNVVGTGDGIAF
jgi:hypothetical protein